MVCIHTCFNIHIRFKITIISDNSCSGMCTSWKSIKNDTGGKKMLQIENAETMNWRAAIRGMRNPLNSWDKSDSGFNANNFDMPCILGPNDLKLMKSLVNAGTDHSKFMRMITVSFDIIAPLCWWKEFDTYKIGTVRNSCSTMHKIESRELTILDFSIEDMDAEDLSVLKHVIGRLNKLIVEYRLNYNDEYKKNVHRRICKLLPDGYLQRATITTNYQVLRNIRNSQRKTHKLEEWKTDFMKFIDSLPYAKELLIADEKGRNM